MLSASLACFSRIQTFLLSASREDHRLSFKKGDAVELVPPETSPSFQERSVAIELHDLRRNLVPAPGAPLMIISQASFGSKYNEVPILKDISLSVRKGHLTFIIGNVGSGKSTLMKAMLGETDPLEGSISSDIRTVAYVGQDPWIQNLTIRQNILGVSGYDRDWYSSVVGMCGLEQDILELPNRDATKAGTGGVSLSGGQKQRLALARAVYSREEVIFLDDVFSGQDPATEQHLHKSLFSERGLLRRMGTTVVCITSQSKPVVNLCIIL